jgi:hypothetical protein
MTLSSLANRFSKWLDRSERYLGWIAVPHIGVLFITLQALGFIFVSLAPEWIFRLALLPDAAKSGEWYRLVTFLALPLDQSPIWVFFALWFLWFVFSTLEQHWGAYKTTLYVMVSVIVMVAYSLAFDYPIIQVRHFEWSLFLAAALLFPEFEITLFFVLPVKMKWLAALTGLFIAIDAFQGTWADRFFLVSIYSNFLLFFGPQALASLEQRLRRERYKRSIR